MQTASEISTVLQALNNRWNDAFNRGQAAEVAAMYDAAATIMPAGGPQVTGAEEIRAFWQSLFDMGATGHTIEQLEAGVDQNLAYQRCRWGVTLPGADGNRQSIGGSLMLLHRKQPDGQWKLMSHIWN